MSSSTESRRERLLAARTDRQRLADEQRRRRGRQKTIRLIVAAVVVAALVGLAGVWLSQTAFAPQPGVAVASEGRDHVNPGSPLTFKSNPPSSGAHYPNWSRPGVYAEPLDPGLWVHSLEHGYVAILYNCPSACPELLSQLRQFYDSAPKSKRYGYPKLVVTPYPQLNTPLAAVAWGRVDELASFDRERLMRFFEAYQDKGPEDAS